MIQHLLSCLIGFIVAHLVFQLALIIMIITSDDEDKINFLRKFSRTIIRPKFIITQFLVILLITTLFTR